MYAPIIIFAFNRLDVLQDCVYSLCLNSEAKDSDLYVFVDGARPYKDGEDFAVNSVREFVKSIVGFRSVRYRFSEYNCGLATSIIYGVTEVIKTHGKAIVVEDDLSVSRNFLSFMNQSLEKYKENKKVFSICGYTNRITPPQDYKYDAYFCTRSSSWGWATWKDRWDAVDWELRDWSKHKKNARKFNKWGGSDCWRLLRFWHEGRNSSWAIRFCYAQFLTNSLSLFPTISKINNEGFDGNGTNCKKWTRMKFDFDISDNKLFKYPSSLEINHSLYKQSMAYNGLLIRIWSRIMYIIHN